MKIKLKTMIKRIYNFLFGFSECSKCENFEECDLRVWLHRSEDNCNYGTKYGKKRWDELCRRRYIVTYVRILLKLIIKKLKLK